MMNRADVRNAIGNMYAVEYDGIRYEHIGGRMELYRHERVNGKITIKIKEMLLLEDKSGHSGVWAPIEKVKLV